jgi:hypothetical protein
MRTKSQITRDAELGRLIQAAAILKKFRIDRGREPQSIGELEAWARHHTSLIDPDTVLTQAEMRSAINSR